MRCLDPWKTVYACASGRGSIHSFSRFCLGEMIGTHGPCPSPYDAIQYDSYNDVLTLYNALPDHQKPYCPILGIEFFNETKSCYGVYLIKGKVASLVYYIDPKNGIDFLVNDPDSNIELLESVGCLDYC